MGLFNTFLLLSSSCSLSKVLLTTTDVHMESVEYIEERCRDINNPLKILTGKHCYLLLSTPSGTVVRYDYTVGSFEPSLTVNYWELFPAETFRKAQALPNTTVEQATRIIRKHSVKQPYDLLTHNCQHVCRDAFNELTGTHHLALRNDYLRWTREQLPPSQRRDFDCETADLEGIQGTIQQVSASLFKSLPFSGLSTAAKLKILIAEMMEPNWSNVS